MLKIGPGQEAAELLIVSFQDEKEVDPVMGARLLLKGITCSIPTTADYLLHSYGRTFPI